MTKALIAGRRATVEEAVTAAAALLRKARFPLVFGLVQSTVEAQREAVRLAESLGGAIDIAATSGRLSALSAFAQAGLVTASLGALRKHADLVMFWGCDPDLEHPGFVARFLGEKAGTHRAVVDVGDATGPAGGDERVAVAAAQEVGALLALRALVRGRRVEPPRAVPPGLPLEGLRAVAKHLRSCEYGVIVYDGDAPLDRREPERAWALSLLARDANQKACLRLFAVRAPGNAVGAENVLAWRTGFPAAVTFAGRGPRYGPGDASGEALLGRGDVDAALLVGAEASISLTAAAQAHLGGIPTVRLGQAPPEGTEGGAVFIATAPLAATPGCVFRMDGIALRQAPSRPDLDAAGGLPTEAAVLGQIGAALLAPVAGGRV